MFVLPVHLAIGDSTGYLGLSDERQGIPLYNRRNQLRQILCKNLMALKT